jgi:glutathione S-transferase
MNAPPRTLLTFAPMVDSETSRLLLAYYDVEHAERDHLFGWVSLLAFLRSGNPRVPLLHGGGLKLNGPRRIADHFDARLFEAQRLFPKEAPLAAQAESDWHDFNDLIGADTAVFSYFHLLPERALMTRIFAAPVPSTEAALTPDVYPLLRWAFTSLLRLTPDRARDAADRIRRIFDATDRRVADGRPYLWGERISIGDIALAAASAALLLPPGYGAKMPSVEEMPAPVAALIHELRARPTGAFVARLYAEGFAAARLSQGH